MKAKTRYTILASLAAIPLVLASCADLQGSLPNNPAPGVTLPGNTLQSNQSVTATSSQTGAVEVRVTDAPPKQEVTAVLVTVDSVEIHQAGADQDGEKGWLPMTLSGPATFDLLQVQGLEQILASATLAAGTYSQIRMSVSKVEVTFKDDGTKEATVPSGKLKFVRSFEVVAGKSTVLLFDFDAARSVNVTGNGKVMFKPVIKLSVTETPGALEIITPGLPNGEVGVGYNAALAAIGGQTPYTWSVDGGSLPAGLTLDAAAGVISGTPTAAGDFTFTIKAVDGATSQKSGTRSYTVNIAASGALQIATSTLPDGLKGDAYQSQLQAIGTGTFTWSLAAGSSLPAGLSLAANGVISGTPTVDGDYTFTVQVSNGTSTDTQALAIHIDSQVSP